MKPLTNLPRRVWKSAQFYIGFHKDQKGRHRATAKVWPPSNGFAVLHDDPAQQEAFLVIKSARDRRHDEIQLKLRPDSIALRRDPDYGWSGIKIEEHKITVLVGEVEISIASDGSIRRSEGEATTWVEADGGVLKKTAFVEASMSADGIELARRTDTSISAISQDGLVSKSR